ncbi:UNVERIFIED_CONTAM: hypothetical protein K2H54_041243 [Gekko kuhli]
MDPETAEEELDQETLVETLTWEQLKSFLKKAIKTACDNLAERYQKASNERNKEGDCMQDSQGHMGRQDYLQETKKEPIKKPLSPQGKDKQETSKEPGYCSNKLKTFAPGEKIMKRLGREKKKALKTRQEEKKAAKTLKIKKREMMGLLKVGKMVLRKINAIHEYKDLRHVVEIQKRREVLERGGRNKRLKLYQLMLIFFLIYFLENRWK